MRRMRAITTIAPGELSHVAGAQGQPGGFATFTNPEPYPVTVGSFGPHGSRLIVESGKSVTLPANRQIMASGLNWLSNGFYKPNGRSCVFTTTAGGNHSFVP
jgi:hypothetical protein